MNMAWLHRQSKVDFLLRELQPILAKFIIYGLANLIIHESISAFFLPLLQPAQIVAL